MIYNAPGCSLDSLSQPMTCSFPLLVLSSSSCVDWTAQIRMREQGSAGLYMFGISYAYYMYTRCVGCGGHNAVCAAKSRNKGWVEVQEAFDYVGGTIWRVRAIQYLSDSLIFQFSRSCRI